MLDLQAWIATVVNFAVSVARKFKLIEQDIEAISTAQGNYIPNTEKGKADGVAELDIDGKVPVSQLPSYYAKDTADILIPYLNQIVYITSDGKPSNSPLEAWRYDGEVNGWQMLWMRSDIHLIGSLQRVSSLLEELSYNENINILKHKYDNDILQISYDLDQMNQEDLPFLDLIDIIKINHLSNPEIFRDIILKPQQIYYKAFESLDFSKYKNVLQFIIDVNNDDFPIVGNSLKFDDIKIAAQSLSISVRNQDYYEADILVNNINIDTHGDAQIGITAYGRSFFEIGTISVKNISMVYIYSDKYYRQSKIGSLNIEVLGSTEWHYANISFTEVIIDSFTIKSFVPMVEEIGISLNSSIIKQTDLDHLISLVINTNTIVKGKVELTSMGSIKLTSAQIQQLSTKGITVTVN